MSCLHRHPHIRTLQDLQIQYEYVFHLPELSPVDGHDTYKKQKMQGVCTMMIRSYILPICKLKKSLRGIEEKWISKKYNKACIYNGIVKRIQDYYRHVDKRISLLFQYITMENISLLFQHITIEKIRNSSPMYTDFPTTSTLLYYLVDGMATLQKEHILFNRNILGQIRTHIPHF